MTALRLYAARTCGALLGSASAAVGAVLFLAVSSFLFARALTVAEGRVAAAAVLWTAAAQPSSRCSASICVRPRF